MGKSRWKGCVAAAAALALAVSSVPAGPVRAGVPEGGETMARITPETARIAEGEKQQFTAELPGDFPEDAKGTAYAWEFTETGEDGKEEESESVEAEGTDKETVTVTALEEAEVTVTCTVSYTEKGEEASLERSAALTIYGPDEEEQGAWISPQSSRIAVGGTEKLVLEAEDGIPDEAEDVYFHWAFTDGEGEESRAVAVVDADGNTVETEGDGGGDEPVLFECSAAVTVTEAEAGGLSVWPAIVTERDGSGNVTAAGKIGSAPFGTVSGTEGSDAAEAFGTAAASYEAENQTVTDGTDTYIALGETFLPEKAFSAEGTEGYVLYARAAPPAESGEIEKAVAAGGGTQTLTVDGAGVPVSRGVAGSQSMADGTEISFSSVDAETAKSILDGYFTPAERAKAAADGLFLTVTAAAYDETADAEGAKASVEAEIAKSLAGHSPAKWLDLGLTAQIGTGAGAVARSVEEAGGDIDVTVKIPEGIRASGNVYGAVRFHGGSAQSLDTASTSSEVSFGTSRFSVYALTYKKAAAAADGTAGTAAKTSAAGTKAVTVYKDDDDDDDEEKTFLIGKGTKKAYYMKAGKDHMRYIAPAAPVTAKKLRVPATVKRKKKTYKVVSVTGYSFTGYDRLKKLIIGRHVIRISADAFSGCGKLKTIRLNSRKLKIRKAKNSLRDSGVKKVLVPEERLARYRKAFAKKNSGKKVEVAATGSSKETAAGSAEQTSAAQTAQSSSAKNTGTATSAAAGAMSSGSGAGSGAAQQGSSTGSSSSPAGTASSGAAQAAPSAAASAGSTSSASSGTGRVGIE